MAGGMHGRGHVWRGVAGGHVWQGVCMAGGHVWWGACVEGDVHGRGACVVGGMHGRSGMHGGGVVQCPPADTTRYGDTVNERAVRILLECIIV